jgi:mannose-1-phosphate guanylyltransferase/mannose-6-phosphate isomerase
MVAEQLREIDIRTQGIILEPIGRNTAPAIALAALYMKQLGKTDNTVLLVLPADHVIQNVSAFHQAINKALYLALQGNLVTFGIVPQHAETGYGYIQWDMQQQVKRFVEKPDLATAEGYVNSGDYLWNSGMFMFNVDSYLQELQQHHPTMLELCSSSMSQSKVDQDFIRVHSDSFQQCLDISIDYAVMEKTNKAKVIPLDAGWNDVGAWSAVWEVSQANQEGNVVRGDVLTHSSTNNLIYSDQRLVALVGVDNLVVVDTKDATLVAHKDHVQQVKKIVDQLNNMQRSEATIHREVNRPWGSYDCIDNGQRFQVKRIVVKAGEKLSLQMHHHRAEHWIVVSGTAQVRCGDKTFLLTENQSTYIPLGEIHSLSNPGKVPLEIIEVQSGSYLGEDDIVRFEDQYGRVQ